MGCVLYIQQHCSPRERWSHIWELKHEAASRAVCECADEVSQCTWTSCITQQQEGYQMPILAAPTDLLNADCQGGRSGESSLHRHAHSLCNPPAPFKGAWSDHKHHLGWVCPHCQVSLPLLSACCRQSEVKQHQFARLMIQSGEISSMLSGATRLQGAVIKQERLTLLGADVFAVWLATLVLLKL